MHPEVPQVKRHAALYQQRVMARITSMNMQQIETALRRHQHWLSAMGIQKSANQLDSMRSRVLGALGQGR